MSRARNLDSPSWPVLYNHVQSGLASGVCRPWGSKPPRRRCATGCVGSNRCPCLQCTYIHSRYLHTPPVGAPWSHGPGPGVLHGLADPSALPPFALLLVWFWSSSLPQLLTVRLLPLPLPASPRLVPRARRCHQPPSSCVPRFPQSSPLPTYFVHLLICSSAHLQPPLGLLKAVAGSLFSRSQFGFGCRV